MPVPVAAAASNAQPAMTNGCRTTAPLAGKSMFMTGFGDARARQDAPDAAVEAREVELTRRVDAERGDAADGRRSAELRRVLDEARRRGFAGSRGDRQRQRPDAAGDKVGEEVPSAIRGAERGAAIHESTAHRLTGRAPVVEDRIGQRQKRRRQVRRDVGGRSCPHGCASRSCVRRVPPVRSRSLRARPDRRRRRPSRPCRRATGRRSSSATGLRQPMLQISRQVA